MLSCSCAWPLVLESDGLFVRPPIRRPHWMQKRLISGCDRLQAGQTCILAHSPYAIYIHGNSLTMLEGTLKVVIDSERKNDGIIDGFKSKGAGVVRIEIESCVVISDFSKSGDVSCEKVFTTELDVQSYPG